MTLFKTIAHERLKALLFPLGFKKRGNTYYRTVGDDVQGLFFQGAQFGHMCSFYFGIIPEYVALQKGLDGIGRYSLECFGGREEVWEYFNNEESIHAYLDEKIEKIKKYILPYFEHPHQPPGTYLE
jgi:hypothetical protein